ncbi:hypothetical protein GOBAR_AA23473 [Gossypium barbadense]|uniref:Uncharacterized protein n=1 Tax=Gossypium barbadense TaxID=3634 RepID=A0A2P5X1H6_GOSBA|nr:hypothetical protein GOBAR_AA23473 [Gossypium barbadense]
MLTNFISVSETRFQNTETTLKNQQASIQGLETQVGQLAKLISKRPQEPRQGILVSKGKGEMDHNEKKPVSELTLHVGDETISLQARNSSSKLNIEGGCMNHDANTNHVMQPSLEETHLKSIHEPCSSKNKGTIYEKRRLQVDEQDEWQTPVKAKPKAQKIEGTPR